MTLTTGSRATLPVTLGQSVTGLILEQSRHGIHSRVAWDNGATQWHDTDSLRETHD